MLKLMKLELTKHGNKTVRNWAITTLIMGVSIFALLFGLVVLIPRLSETTELVKDLLEMKNDVNEIGEKALIEMILNVVFVIYSGVQYAVYVVQNVRNKEIEQLFTYPISRAKIMFAKVATAALLTITSYIITSLAIMITFHVIGVPGLLQVSTFTNILVNSFVIVLVPLGGQYIGLWRESTVVTIVATFLLASIFQGNMGTLRLSQLPIISYIFSAIMVFGLFIMMRIYTEKDFLN